MELALPDAWSGHDAPEPGQGRRGGRGDPHPAYVAFCYPRLELKIGHEEPTAPREHHYSYRGHLTRHHVLALSDNDDDDAGQPQAPPSISLPAETPLEQVPAGGSFATCPGNAVLFALLHRQDPSLLEALQHENRERVHAHQAALESEVRAASAPRQDQLVHAVEERLRRHLASLQGGGRLLRMLPEAQRQEIERESHLFKDAETKLKLEKLQNLIGGVAEDAVQLQLLTNVSSADIRKNLAMFRYPPRTSIIPRELPLHQFMTRVAREGDDHDGGYEWNLKKRGGARPLRPPDFLEKSRKQKKGRATVEFNILLDGHVYAVTGYVPSRDLSAPPVAFQVEPSEKTRGSQLIAAEDLPRHRAEWVGLLTEIRRASAAPTVASINAALQKRQSRRQPLDARGARRQKRALANKSAEEAEEEAEEDVALANIREKVRQARAAQAQDGGGGEEVDDDDSGRVPIDMDTWRRDALALVRWLMERQPKVSEYQELEARLRHASSFWQTAQREGFSPKSWQLGPATSPGAPPDALAEQKRRRRERWLRVQLERARALAKAQDVQEHLRQIVREVQLRDPSRTHACTGLARAFARSVGIGPLDYFHPHRLVAALSAGGFRTALSLHWPKTSDVPPDPQGTSHSRWALVREDGSPKAQRLPVHGAYDATPVRSPLHLRHPQDAAGMVYELYAVVYHELFTSEDDDDASVNTQIKCGCLFKHGEHWYNYRARAPARVVSLATGEGGGGDEGGPSAGTVQWLRQGWDEAVENLCATRGEVYLYTNRHMEAPAHYRPVPLDHGASPGSGGSNVRGALSVREIVTAMGYPPLHEGFRTGDAPAARFTRYATVPLTGIDVLRQKVLGWRRYRQNHRAEPLARALDAACETFLQDPDLHDAAVVPQVEKVRHYLAGNATLDQLHKVHDAWTRRRLRKANTTTEPDPFPKFSAMHQLVLQVLQQHAWLARSSSASEKWAETWFNAHAKDTLRHHRPLVQKFGISLRPRLTRQGDVVVLLRRPDTRSPGSWALSEHEEAHLQLQLALLPDARGAHVVLYTPQGQAHLAYRARDAKWWGQHRAHVQSFVRLFHDLSRQPEGTVERALRAWEASGVDFILAGDAQHPERPPTPLNDGQLHARCLRTNLPLQRQPPQQLDNGEYHIIYRAMTPGAFNDVYAVSYSSRDSTMPRAQDDDVDDAEAIETSTS